jgi:hypothetical protein
MLASLSGSINPFIASHGLVAVFALMLMVPGGALAAQACAASGFGALGQVLAAGRDDLATALAGSFATPLSLSEPPPCSSSFRACRRAT